LRAFAILLVMFSHAIWEFDLASLSIPAPLANLLRNGFSGVDLFFVLSGFLITSQLLRRPLTGQTLRRFFLHRFFRIAPAYYVSLTLFLALFLVLPMLAHHNAFDVLSYWAGPYVSHLVFNQDYLFSSPHIAAAYWTIPVEMRFYLLCPLLVFGLAFLKSDTRCIGMIAVIFATYMAATVLMIDAVYGGQVTDIVSYFWDIKVKFHFALAGLIAGFLCAYLLQHETVKSLFDRNRLWGNGCFLFGLGLFLLLSMPHSYYLESVTPFAQMVLPFGWALAFGAMVLGTIGGCFAGSFLSGRFLRFIAAISYSLYLVHIFMLNGFLSAVFSTLYDATGHYTLSWLAMLPAYFGVCVCFAYMLHVYVEKPLWLWAKRKWPLSTKTAPKNTEAP